MHIPCYFLGYLSTYLHTHKNTPAYNEIYCMFLDFNILNSKTILFTLLQRIKNSKTLHDLRLLLHIIQMGLLQALLFVTRQQKASLLCLCMFMRLCRRQCICLIKYCQALSTKDSESFLSGGGKDLGEKRKKESLLLTPVPH